MWWKVFLCTILKTKEVIKILASIYEALSDIFYPIPSLPSLYSVLEWSMSHTHSLTYTLSYAALYFLPLHKNCLVQLDYECLENRGHNFSSSTHRKVSAQNWSHSIYLISVDLRWRLILRITFPIGKILEFCICRIWVLLTFFGKLKCLNRGNFSFEFRVWVYWGGESDLHSRKSLCWLFEGWMIEKRDLRHRV